jgi:RNA polymerase sigma factor (sigma-70 family)
MSISRLPSRPPAAGSRTTRAPRHRGARGASRRAGGRPPLPGATGGSDARFLHVAARARLLNAEEERRLAQRARAGDRAALHRLVEANLRLVMAEARSYRGRGLPLADLIQEGALGLIRAAERYDPDRGVRFATYATVWIQSAIATAHQRQVSAISLSTRDARRAAVLRAVDGGRTGSDEALAHRLDLAIERVGTLRAAAAPVASLDAVAGDGPCPVDQLADRDAPPPWLQVLQREAVDAVTRAVAALPEREREVVRRRYALDGAAPETFAEIARCLGVSAERARQIERSAIARLKADGALQAVAEAA